MATVTTIEAANLKIADATKKLSRNAIISHRQADKEMVTKTDVSETMGMMGKMKRMNNQDKLKDGMMEEDVEIGREITATEEVATERKLIEVDLIAEIENGEEVLIPEEMNENDMKEMKAEQEMITKTVTRVAEEERDQVKQGRATRKALCVNTSLRTDANLVKTAGLAMMKDR